MVGNSNPIYSRRKRFLPEYRELFTALLKIPDVDVRDRVTDAVNSIVRCSVCKRKVEFREFATQTESLPETESSVINKKETISTNQTLLEKKRRKRKRNCPKVVKTAQHSSTMPVLQQDSEQNNVDESERPVKRSRSCSEISTNSNDAAVNAVFQIVCTENFDLESPVQNSDMVERIKKQMMDEWITCETCSSIGFLPIHEAIIQNDLKRLKRQIYVWNYRKVNLMELLTEDGDVSYWYKICLYVLLFLQNADIENPLQLAIKENCWKFIFDELLKQDIQLNDIDGDCNTIIHLAVAYLTDDDLYQQKGVHVLDSILKKVDLKMLLEQNDDGLTPLHMAVKKNQYLMVERILDIIDKRLNLNSVVPLNDPCADQKKFTSYYCRQCDSFEDRQQNEVKTKILNATHMKSGYTALLFAMEMRYDHLIYLLMAHMCSPNIKNLSGLDAKTYYTDYVQDKSPQILGALEALSAVLHK